VIAFGSYSYILLFGALNGVVLAGMLLHARANRGANRVLAALIGVVVLRLVPFIIGYAGFYDAYPWLSFAPFDMPLAIGPLLWLYVHRLTSDRLPPRWHWHLAPATLQFVFYATIFVSCTVPEKTWIDSHVNRWLSPLITALSLMGLAGYGAAAVRRYRDWQRWLDAEFSNREEYRLDWLRNLLVAFAITGLCWLGFAATDALIVRLDYFDVFPMYVWLSVLAYTLGLIGWRGATLEYPIPRGEPRGADAAPLAAFDLPELTAAPMRAGPDWRALGDSYAGTVRGNGWWKDPNLTLPLLARHLATNTTYLSRALNQGLGQSFNEFVNRLRVEAVAAELQAGSTRDLVQIGFDAGFNSKASFQRAFRLYMDTTPSEYRNRYRS
jgi:AraC-like DNA-binding protein